MLGHFLLRLVIILTTKLLASYTVPRFEPPKVSAAGAFSSIDPGPPANMSVRELVIFFAVQLLSVLFHRLVRPGGTTLDVERLRPGLKETSSALNVISDVASQSSRLANRLMRCNAVASAYVPSIKRDGDH